MDDVPHLNDIELFEYAGGELDDAERRRAERHLATCDECRSMLALAQSGASVLQASPRFELPPERVAATLAALGTQTSPEAAPVFWRRRWLTVLAPVAAVAGAIAITVVAVTGNDDSGREAAAPTFELAPEEAAAETPLEPTGEANRSLQSSENAADGATSDAAAPESESLGEASDLESPAQQSARSAEAPQPAAPAEPAAAEPDPADAPAPTAASAESAESEPAPAPAEAAPEEEPASPRIENVIASVAGPAEDVVALLATVGIDATIADDGAIEVALDDAEDATDVLDRLPAGLVVVRVAETP